MQNVGMKIEFNLKNAAAGKWVFKFFLCQRIRRTMKNNCLQFIANLNSANQMLNLSFLPRVKTLL